jgi:hypothetical protein
MNAALRRDVAAYAVATVAEWALWVSLLVHTYERSGTAAAGFVSLGLLASGAIAVPFAGPLADGPRPDRVLFASYLLQSAALATSASAAAAGASVPLVVAPACVAIMAITLVRPSLAVVVPGHAASARQLTTSNLAMGLADSTSTLAGPLAAAGLVAWRGTAAALAASATLAAAAAAISVVGLRSGSAAGAPTTRRRRGPRALADATVAFAQLDGGKEMLATVGAHYVVIGALDLLVVVLADAVLDLGASGPGVLSATIGLGAVGGSVAARGTTGRRTLAPVILASLLATALGLVLVGASGALVVSVLLLPLVGASSAVGDVTARILIQRAAPQHALASVFSVVEVIGLACCALGSLVAQLVLSFAGAREALAAVGILVIAVALATARRLRRIDDAADAPVVTIRLLRSTRILAPLAPPAVEALARNATELEVDAGAVIVREGGVGDQYYVIAEGSVAVSMDGSPIRTMSRPEGFGEIALLADVPRTATVTACSPTRLLAIRRADFLLAVTGDVAVRDAAWQLTEGWVGVPTRAD